MPINADEAFVASDGHIYVAPTDATAPSDATTAMSSVDSDWLDLGYVSEDGVALQPGQDITDIFVWQSFYPLKKIPTGKRFEATFAMAQLNDATFALAFGGGTTTGSDPGPYVFTPAGPETLDERSLVVEVIENLRVYRFYVPVGIVTETSEITFNRQSIVQLPITFSAIASADGDAWKCFISDSNFLVS